MPLVIANTVGISTKRIAALIGSIVQRVDIQIETR